nr:hypothetical protein [uncultured Gellertiella sp.]
MAGKKAAQDNHHQILSEIRDALLRQCDLFEQGQRQSFANNEKYREIRQAELDRTRAQQEAVTAENRSDMLKTQNHLKFMRRIQLVIAAFFLALLAGGAVLLVYLRP